MEWLFPWRGLPRRPLAFFSLLLPLLFGSWLWSPAAAAFTVTTLGDYDNVTVMQVSGSYDVAYLDDSPDLSARRTIAREFYRTHGDDYDFLVIFTNFNFAMPPGAKAFFSPAKNDIRGIGVKLNGQELYDYTYAYSPTGSYLVRLNGTIDMANIASHVLEPADPEFDDTLTTLTHEFLHRWGAYVHFRDGATDSDALLGSGDAHWSYLLDSQGSTLYGNHWRDNNDGTFTAVAPEQIRTGEVIGRIFSPLDLYLMGLVDKSQVPPLLLIDAPGIDKNQLPVIGDTLPGVARTVTIDDIVAAEGERIPAAAESRKEFRVAFVYAVTPGTWSASEAQDRGEVVAINRLQTEWEKRFSILTDGIALMRTDFVVPESLETNPGVTAPTVTPAVTPSVNSGVAWLVNQQQPGGYWQDQPGTDRRDTAAAVAALKAFPAGAGAAADGQAWLGTVTPENSDFLARKLLSLSSANVTALVALQNADGGWGSAPGYASNPVDTALVLQAMTARGGIDGGVLAAAIDYLHAAQNADGGWSPGRGASTVQATAQVLLALSACRGDYPLEPAIADGLVWLTARQSAAGGFGDGAVSVVDTAVALQALRALAASNEVTDRAGAWLLARQAADGSWGGGVFATAQAVAALRPVASTPPAIGFVQTSSAGYEGERTVPIEVGLSHPWSRPVTVDFHWSAAGTATPGDDFTLAAGTLVFPAGETVRTIDLVLRDDLQGEMEESIVLMLDNPGGGASLAAGLFTYQLHDNEVPPVVEITAPVMRAYASLTIAVDYVASHGVIRVFLNGLPVAIPADGVLSLLGDGDYLLRVEATDGAGRVGWDEVSFTVDTISPTVSILSPLGGVYPGDTLPLLYQVGDGLVSKVLLDGQPTGVRSGGALGPLADGEHRISITAADEAGNTTVAVRSFVIAKDDSASSWQAEPPPELSTSQEIIRTSYYERGTMRLDAAGNAYFATIRYSAAANYDILVYKLDRSGQPLWSQPVELDFPFDAYLGGMEIDACGNVAVFGRAKGSHTNASGAIVEDWDYDLFAAKINSAGTLAWTKTWGSVQNDTIYAGHLAKNGNLYLTGSSDGPIDGSYGDNPGEEMFITVFDPAGIRKLNANYPNPTGWAIAADQSGNIFFVDGEALRKYSPAGQLVWSMPYGGIYRIAFDRQGDLVLGLNPLQKIDPASGATLWRAEPIVMQPLPGSTGKLFEVGWLGFDDNNDIYLLGRTNQQLDGHLSLDGNDPYLAKFDRQGQKLWVKQLDAPLEGAFSGGFVTGSDLLFAARYWKADSSFAPDYVFTLDTFALTSVPAAAGLGDSYYLASASACGGVSYNQGPVSVRLTTVEPGCTAPDRVAMSFKGTKDLVISSLANGGYRLATDVELAAFGNALTVLAADSAGTATVALLEIDPVSGLAVRTLATKSFALTAGLPAVIRDLSGMAGRIAAGKTFGVKLSMVTAARSNNSISWGSAFDCPIGSRQYLRVIERAVDEQAPDSAVHVPAQGAQLLPGCSLVEGVADDGAGRGIRRVEVSLDNGLTWHSATDTSADQSWSSWAYPWCPVQSSSYLLISRATDRAGNVEGPNTAVAVTVGGAGPMLLSIAPSSIAVDQPSAVTLIIEQFDPQAPAVQIRVTRDTARDGLPDGDPTVQLFQITDGVSTDNPNVPGDEDGQVNGRIVTTLNFAYRYDVRMAPGDYVITGDTNMTAVSKPFRVTATSQSQTIQGYVLDPQNTPRGGATVQLLDKGGRSHGYAFTDSAGHYLFNVPVPGEYLLLPTLENYVIARANLVPHTLASGQHLNVDLSMVAGSFKVAGQVRDAGTTAQVNGGILIRAESSQYLAAPMTSAHGSYEIHLPAGDYQLFADAYTTQGAAAQGYLGSRNPLGQVTVAAASTGNNLQLSKATALVCGQVRDAATLEVAGLVVEAVTDSGTGRFATAVSDADGNYCLGLINDGRWQVALNDAADQPLDYVGNTVSGITATAGPFNGVDLVVYPVEGRVEGTVKEGVQPVAGILVKATCAATGAIATGRTAPDGSYRLGVHAGTWQVAIAAEPLGYNPVAPVSAAVDAGGTVSRNFAVSKPVQPVNTIAITKAAYDTRKRMLNIQATSNNANAQLQVVGHGPMTYSKLTGGKYYWNFAKSLPTKPATVTVAGPEGSRTATVQ